MPSPSVFEPPRREYLIVAAIVIAFLIDVFSGYGKIPLAIAAALAVFPTLLGAVRALWKRKLTIDTFNALAVAASFATNEIRSAAFIGLMLTFARYLDWRTESRARHAIEELMRLKPAIARRETASGAEDVPVDEVKKGDVVIVSVGSRVPVDGIVIGGDAHVNEASVTGESRLVMKRFGDRVVSSTLVESGGIRMRATDVGADSTIERMATLIREATANKSRAERMADKFAGMFLPLVALLGFGTYVWTRDIRMTAAIFLVACADDMAVAIPLAVTAAVGRAAKRGVIIKGGEWLDVLGRLKTVVLDKTGTLTYGSLAIARESRAIGVSEKAFWQAIGTAEKFSEHPVGKLAYAEAVARAGKIPDPLSVDVRKGAGVVAKTAKGVIAVGSDKLAEELHLSLPEQLRGEMSFHVFLDGTYAGTVFVADTPRPEAAESLQRLRRRGIGRISMFTGDNPETAKTISRQLGITDVRASMSPRDKLRELEKLLRDGPVAMVGDGVNDAPALARADVGIAMGGGGTAIASETADVVILSDNLMRLPEIVALGRETSSVIRWDMAIWAVTNVVGFGLVFTGLIGPSFAAFYNFATDFLPLLNSARLFRERSGRSML